MTTFLILNYIFFLFMFKKPICPLSLVLFPLTCLSILSTFLFDLKETQGEIDYNLVIHIVFSLLSYGFLGLAGLQANFFKIPKGYKLRNIKNSVSMIYCPQLRIWREGCLNNCIWIHSANIVINNRAPFVVINQDYYILEKISFSLIAWIVYFYLIFQHFSSKITGKKQRIWLWGNGFSFYCVFRNKNYFIKKYES
ncbi:MAG: hypothetical protein Ct9H90mP18_08610 [Gammaproteobacteria bacterium]|nr:MAG: hypothetical protein Ct9H90mP18_08610 [Gammaproteobacteria bacterium]